MRRSSRSTVWSFVQLEHTFSRWTLLAPRDAYDTEQSAILGALYGSVLAEPESCAVEGARSEEFRPAML